MISEEQISCYQRPNSDCLPLPNGSGSRKPPPPPHRSSKDEVTAPVIAIDSFRLASYLASSSLESKQRARALPSVVLAVPSSSAAATPSPVRDNSHHHPASPSYLGGDGASAARSGARGGAALVGPEQAHARPLRRHPVANIPCRSSAPSGFGFSQGRRLLSGAAAALKGGGGFL